MSDDEVYPTPSESDNVSDVNPEEMAQLMADLDGMDSDLFRKKSTISAMKNDTPYKKSGENNFSHKEVINTRNPVDENKLLDAFPPSTSKRLLTEYDVKKSPLQTSTKLDKNKLISEIFDDSETNIRNEASLDVISHKKSKADINFDDDSDPLNMVLKPKSQESGYMDSLLGKSSVKKVDKKSQNEFVMPEHYKMSGDLVGPSKKKVGLSEASSQPLDKLFGESSSKPRRRNAPKTVSSYQIDDDDILGERKISHETENNERKVSKKDDWLFGSPVKGSKLKNEIDSSSVQATVEHSKSMKTGTPNKDWLNNLLSSNKNSPSKLQKTQTFISTEKTATNSPLNSTAKAPDKHAVGSLTPIIQGSGTILNPVYSPQRQIEEQQMRMDSDTAVVASRIQLQKQEAEAQMMQQMQLQMQEQQQRMAQMMQLNLNPSMNYSVGANKLLIEDDESVKQLKIDLHKAQTDVGRLEAELTLVREQHETQLEIIKDSQRKKEEVEQDLWRRKEESFMQERNALIEDHQIRRNELQKERELFTADYKSKVVAVKAEMNEALSRANELYGAVIERMKREHNDAIERLEKLKEIEVKAALDATARVKNVDVVLDQLESNTFNLTAITNAIHEKHDNALDLTKKALQSKERQLKEMESNLSVVRAESESERNRLTVLVNRLESTLSNQGTEVESQKWNLAQEKMKLEVERTSLREEKRHFQSVMENERRELASVKESFLREQKEMMQTIARQKSQIYEVETRNRDNFVTAASEVELLQLIEDKKALEEKLIKFQLQKEEKEEEHRFLEEKTLKLEEENVKNNDLKDDINRKCLELEMKANDLERREAKLDELHRSINKKMNDVTQSTQKLHFEQESLVKERGRLELDQEAANRTTRSLCQACASTLLPTVDVRGLDRIPGDGSEAHKAQMHKETLFTKSFDPVAVLNRLSLAREQLKRIKDEKRLLMRRESLS